MELGGGLSCSVPCPPCLPVTQRMSPVSPSDSCAPRRGGGGGRGSLVAVPLTSGARGSRSAAAAVRPAIPPLPHFSVGPFATARACSLPRRGPRAIASPRGALVGCACIDTLLPGRGSGLWGLATGRGGGAGLVPSPFPPPPAPGVSGRAPESSVALPPPRSLPPWPWSAAGGGLPHAGRGSRPAPLSGRASGPARQGVGPPAHLAGASPTPHCFPCRQCTSPVSPSDSFIPPGGGGRRLPLRSHPVRGPSWGSSPGSCSCRTSWQGAWIGWWPCGHRPEDKRVWLTAVQRPGSPELGTKGAIVGQASQLRYPEVLYARAPRPDRRSGRRPYTWRWYLVPMWREETAQPLWRQPRPGLVERWDNPPPC